VRKELLSKADKRTSGEKKGLAPSGVGVKQIHTRDLVANPYNPRMLFDSKPMAVLRSSIEKVGILVPLTVYRDATKDRYVILDGQRRWMCAQELGLEPVPVNEVAEPTVVQNIVTMFNIHKFREDWELMPTALTLEILMRELEEKNEKRLAELTGLDRAVVSRCKKLLSYSRKFQDMMLDLNPDRRIKADFFIELYYVVADKLMAKASWFKKDEFIERMLFKYRNKKGLKAVTDFRLMKEYMTNARRARKDNAILSRLRRFTYDDTLTLSYLAIESAAVSAGARKLLININRLEEAIGSLDAEEYYGEESLWKSLESLFRLIRSKLEAAGRRVTG
jgi:ParB family transcriptional regulator, chromosome partitioning protein